MASDWSLAYGTLLGGVGFGCGALASLTLAAVWVSACYSAGVVARAAKSHKA